MGLDTAHAEQQDEQGCDVTQAAVTVSSTGSSSWEHLRYFKQPCAVLPSYEPTFKNSLLMLFLASQVAASVLQQLHEASSQDTARFQVMCFCMMPSIS